MPALRFLFRAALASLLLLLVTAILTASGPDPALYPAKPGDPVVEIIAADHGIHVALIMPRAELARVAAEQGLQALVAVSDRFAAYDNLEIGWGDEGFYRMRQAFDGATVIAGLRALTGLNDRTAIYAAGTIGDPARNYRMSSPVRLKLSSEGFTRLAVLLDQSFDISNGQPTELGPGQYGASLFYRAEGRYSLFNVCNHWTSRLLAAAGVPTTPVVDTISALFMRDLQWRAGATPAL